LLPASTILRLNKPTSMQYRIKTKNEAMTIRRKGKRQFPLYNYLQRTKRFYYNKGDEKVLPSGFIEGQTWGGLYKACMGFIIANSHDDLEKKGLLCSSNSKAAA
jgi:hypothetical protein